MTQCYGYRSDTGHIFNQSSSNVSSCPSGQGCCFSSDICLSNNICLGKSPANASASYSGYYIGSCTDPTYQSPYCPKQCTSKTSFSIVYNYTTSLWACCSGNYGLGTVRCDVPTDETFYAPSPEKLIRLPTTAGSTSTSNAGLLSSSSASANPSATTSIASAPTGRVTYTPGATAGIAIGTAFGAILLFLILGWFGCVYRSRRYGSKQNYQLANPKDDDKIFIHSWRGSRAAEADNNPSLIRYQPSNAMNLHEVPAERIYEAPPHGASRSNSARFAGNTTYYPTVRSEGLPHSTEHP